MCSKRCSVSRSEGENWIETQEQVKELVPWCSLIEKGGRHKRQAGQQIHTRRDRPSTTKDTGKETNKLSRVICH
jgi:hypothetical protein